MELARSATAAAIIASLDELPPPPETEPPRSAVGAASPLRDQLSAWYDKWTKHWQDGELEAILRAHGEDALLRKVWDASGAFWQVANNVYGRIEELGGYDWLAHPAYTSAPAK